LEDPSIRTTVVKYEKKIRDGEWSDINIILNSFQQLEATKIQSTDSISLFFGQQLEILSSMCRRIARIATDGDYLMGPVTGGR